MIEYHAFTYQYLFKAGPMKHVDSSLRESISHSFEMEHVSYFALQKS
jgi:hypothetical protein